MAHQVRKIIQLFSVRCDFQQPHATNNF